MAEFNAREAAERLSAMDLLAKQPVVINARPKYTWDFEPEKYQGEIRNLPERPYDRFAAPIAESLSPTMGGYGMGQALGETLSYAGAGDYENAAAVGIPAAIGALIPAPGAKAKSIRAFHGSPHDFDKFDASRIGTGEGAQAYGHGLYFAESEGVARSYRDSLSGLNVSGQQLSRPEAVDAFSTVAKAAAPIDQGTADFISTNVVDGLKGQFDLDKLGADLIAQRPNDGVFAKAVDAAIGEAKKATRAPGRMYEVRINAEPDQFLDWDQPLSQQALPALQQLPPSAQAHFDAMGIVEPTGGNLFAALSKVAGKVGTEKWNRPQSADALREAGIPGIRYLDQQSRGDGDGTHNYVVFPGNEHLVEIVRKYGIAGAATLYGMSESDVAQAMEGHSP